MSPLTKPPAKTIVEDLGVVLMDVIEWLLSKEVAFGPSLPNGKKARALLARIQASKDAAMAPPKAQSPVPPAGSSGMAKDPSFGGQDAGMAGKGVATNLEHDSISDHIVD
jgi:hypothetical protein